MKDQSQLDPVRPMAALRRARDAKHYSKDAYGGVSCGDSVAVALAGLEVGAVEILARKLGIDPTKYAKLNPGQRRMNCANRIRGMLQRGELSREDFLTAYEPVIAANPRRPTLEAAKAAKAKPVAAKVAPEPAAEEPKAAKPKRQRKAKAEA